jgi:uncharacterized protein YdeI (YjbR/CyaY-like superfamily)
MIRLNRKYQEAVRAAAEANRRAGDWVTQPPFASQIIIPDDVAKAVEEEESRQRDPSADGTDSR